MFDIEAIEDFKSRCGTTAACAHKLLWNNLLAVETSPLQIHLGKARQITQRGAHPAIGQCSSNAIEGDIRVLFCPQS
ncbi:hypothetical protein D3C86_2098880 [compost metagenome]